MNQTPTLQSFTEDITEDITKEFIEEFFDDTKRKRRLELFRKIHVFLRIVDAVSNFDSYFQQRIDAVGRKSLSPLEKCTAAMRMLAYGVSADVVDDYVHIGESTAVEGLKKSVSNIITIFEAWKRMFMSGHKGVATIILEAVASSDLWIWHAFFGVAGSNNDINVLDRSPVFDDILQGRAPEVNYIIN
ncbi:uncharacterized protein LOC141718259 [Apium graveolens]|uniref:uncharacterized protein LOC141718259 n=1 Tax=Apium graveolens TaxID=4045 RepID=UPI003D79EE1F